MADVSGVYALAADLGSAAGRVGAAAAVVVRRTAAAIEATAKTLAPVDTGYLRGSIGSDITGDGRHGRMTAVIGPTANYGAYVEFGTSRAGPQPYMIPAAAHHEQAYLDALTEAARRVL